MSEPSRLLDGNLPPHVRLLLEAGRDAEPRASLVETTLQSLRAANLASPPGGLSPLISSVAIPVLAGVLALGALVGFAWTMRAPSFPAVPREARVAPDLTDSGDEGTESSGDARRQRSDQLGTAPVPSTGAGAPVRRSLVSPAQSARPPVRTGPPPTASAPVTPGDAAQKSRSSTLAQRDLVLRARAALDGGAPGKALSILAGYESAFDELRFIPEVLSLRMQAQQRMGNVQAAEQLARRIVAAYPRSSQAGRARQLLEGTGSSGRGN